MVEACVWLSLLVGATFLGVQAYRGVEETTRLISPDRIEESQVAYRYYECLHEALHALVPVGAKVYVDISGLPAFVALASTFPDREVVGSPQEADVVFGMRSPDGWDYCSPGAFTSVERGSIG